MTIGPGAVLTSCVLGNCTVIGEGSVIEAGVEIGEHVVIAPGSVVTRNALIPKNQFWAGNPAKYVRDVTDEEIKAQLASCKQIEHNSKDHMEEFLPYGTMYQEAEKKGLYDETKAAAASAAH